MLRRVLRALNPARWFTALCQCWLNSPPNSPCRNGPALNSMAAATSIAVHASSSGLDNSRQQNHNGIAIVDETKEERRQWIAKVKDQVFNWQFSVFEFAGLTKGHPLITLTMTLLEVYGMLDGWKVDRQTVENYLLQVEAEYNANSYHNSTHACDVTQTSAIIMQSFAKVVNDIPKMDMFCVIMASVVHDLGHLGVNNDFLINSQHPRATTYNDKSVNENYHISRAFEIARNRKGCNIFEHFTFDEQKKCRKLMIDMVIATDMAIHFDLLKNFNSQLEVKPDMNEWQERNLLYQMIVHLADIANPARPFPLARAWAERVIQEFCEQGDKEAAAGLAVSGFCNRANINMPRAQLNFIEIFVKPTLLACDKAAPDFCCMALQSLDKTITEWKALEAAGVKM